MMSRRLLFFWTQCSTDSMINVGSTIDSQLGIKVDILPLAAKASVVAGCAPAVVQTYPAARRRREAALGRSTPRRSLGRASVWPVCGGRDCEAVSSTAGHHLSLIHI